MDREYLWVARPIGPVHRKFLKGLPSVSGGTLRRAEGEGEGRAAGDGALFR